MPHLSIVIPAYNEENRIGRTITETFDYLDKQNYSSEVIVVNDGSTDHTVEAVRKFESRVGDRLRLIENPGNRGKAIPCETECSKPTARSFFFSTLIWRLLRARLSSRRSDSRRSLRRRLRFARARPQLIGTHQSLFREALGRGANWVQFAFTGLRFKDTQCGFKAFRREAAQSVFRLQRIDGFGFDPEILFIAKKQGWRLLETPVRWNHIEGARN